MKKLDSFLSRRKIFLEKLGAKAAIIPAAKMVTHHADCEYPFRQNSDFWYLTGFDEPNAVALFLPHRAKGGQYILFVMPKDSSIEVWEGFRWGVEGVIENFGVDVAHPLDELPLRLAGYLKGSEGISFRIGKHPHLEPLILKVWNEQLEQTQRDGSDAFSMVAPCSILHEMRLIKDKNEICSLREASRISSEAHELVREMARPGVDERFLQGVIEQYFLSQGARGPAYGSIVASGNNACVLHYTSNNSVINNGDLLLVDAGCSLMDYYNGDITRTFPANGRFTGEQKAIYEVVLAAQIAAIKTVLPGNTAEDVHLAAVKVIVEGLLSIGLLVGEADSLIEQQAYRHLFMHRTGHWLGLDVHDVGAYRLGEYPVNLQPGMVLTVEPGIYISDCLPLPDGQPQIAENWKGIGIRIEDDVLVSQKGQEVLTELALKSLKDMERRV